MGEGARALESVPLVSMGIDVGSSGTQIAFSRLLMRGSGEPLAMRRHAAQRQTLYLSPVSLTPFKNAHEIDADRLRAIIDRGAARAREVLVEHRARLDALGERVDADLKAQDVRLTMGGEPTFVSIDDMESPEWNTAAVGGAKRKLADDLIRRLRTRFAPGGLLHFGQGKWYPGESLPRWAFGLYWRKDGVPIWNNAELIAPVVGQRPTRVEEAEQFALGTARRLGIDTLVPAHRLDRETAGLVMFTVQPATRHAYQSLFRDRRIHKVYEAVAGHRPDLTFPLVRHSRLIESERFMAMQETEGEPNAETRIERVAVDGPRALYRLHPVTGQKHQLRAHMNALGLPIEGDRIYPVLQPDLSEGKTPDYRDPLQLLARELSFVDPVTGEARRFESTLRLNWPAATSGR